MRKYLFFILIGCLLATACKFNTREVVVSTWEDGSPQMVHLMKGKTDNAVKVGERRYYQDGTLQFDKHFNTNGKPDGTWQYYYPNGKTFATADFSVNHDMGDHWAIFDTMGNAYFAQHYDSVRVVELGEYDTPASIIYFDSTSRYLFQFFSNGSLRCTGMTLNGLREGAWTFYHPNGLPQVEAHYLGGKENGLYTCYRENGVPYFRGTYINGLRAGVWEFYDGEANLLQTKDYDAK